MSLAIGMNSGSSLDSIDAVLIEIELGNDGQPRRPRFIDGITYQWPAEVERQILTAFANELTIFELTRLNYVAGAVYAEAARSLISHTAVDPHDVTVLGVDGQTIYQEPPDHAGMRRMPLDAPLVARWLDGPYACGLQIGESAIIAAHTGVPTVTHFRPADHALGGTGAPLMQYLDWVAFRDIAPVLTLNIGGIANCHLAQANRSRMIAFDTGPGNVMMDHAARELFHQTHDRDGEIAAAGRVDEAMLGDLRSHPFFERKPPRSAWRRDFGADYADEILARYSGLAPEDIMATLCRFTAVSIVTAIRDHFSDLESVPVLIASGGGTQNKTLMRDLREYMPSHVRLTTSDEFGIPSKFKEAVKFGTLAFANVNRLANNIPACSGASAYAVLGKLALPPGAAVVDPLGEA